MKHRRPFCRWCVLLVAGATAWGAPATVEETLELPAVAPAPGGPAAILASGDGGWAELDREIARRLAAAGLPVIGWDSRAYYWTRRTPAAAASDLGKIMRRCRDEWRCDGIVLIGYSRGADVLPFLVNRLSPDDRSKVRLVALLGPGRAIDFEFHLADFVRDPDPRTALPVVPEVIRLRGLPLLVVFGEQDRSSSAADLPPDLGQIARVPGDHHFARDYDRLARLILRAAGVREGTADPGLAPPR